LVRLQVLRVVVCWALALRPGQEVRLLEVPVLLARAPLQRVPQVLLEPELLELVLPLRQRAPPPNLAACSARWGSRPDSSRRPPNHSSMRPRPASQRPAC
jgi:hypothetical protein